MKLLLLRGKSRTYAFLNSEWLPAVADSVVIWTLLAGGVVIRSSHFLKILLCADRIFLLSIFRPFLNLNKLALLKNNT